MKNLTKTILILAVILFGSLTLVQDAQAQESSDLEIEICYDSALTDCEILNNENQPPLFEETNFLPGDEISSWIKVTNLTGSSKSVAIEAINFGGLPVGSNDLAKALEVEISENGTSLYGISETKTLADFYAYGEMYLSDVDNNTTYQFKIKFPEDKGNEWQQKTTSFDVIIGVEGEEGHQTNGNGGGGGGGTTLPPGMTITGERSVVGTDCESVEIKWNTSYFSTGRVIYSKDGEEHSLNLNDTGDDPPLYGYAATTDEVTDKKTSHTMYLDGLEDNTTYYYRCIAHASPATISKEFSFTTCECEVCEEEDEEELEEPVPVFATGEETGGTGQEETETEEGTTTEESTTSEELTTEEKTPEEESSITRQTLAATIANMFDFNFTLCDLWFILFILLLIYTIYRLLKDRKERRGR